MEHPTWNKSVAGCNMVIIRTGQGIPDDFDIDNAYIGIKKVKQTHD